MSFEKSGYKNREDYNRMRNKYYERTRMCAVFSNRRWTEEEIEKVRTSNKTDRELSKELGRSMKSIQCKRYRLQIKKAEK